MADTRQSRRPQVAIRLAPAERRQLRLTAAERDVSMSRLVREALARYLAQPAELERLERDVQEQRR